MDIIEPQAADGGETLGIEDGQEHHNSVFRFERCIVEELARVLPAFLGADGGGRPSPFLCAEVQGSQLVGVHPTDEVPGFGPQRCVLSDSSISSQAVS